MNPLLYFIPGERGVHPDTKRPLLQRLGLLDVLGDAALGVVNPVRFKGMDGIVIAPRANGGADAHMDESRQTWVECNHGLYWVGWWTDRKPGPDDLARVEYVDGHVVTLSDGAKWLIPCARVLDGDTRLPQVIGFTPDGRARLSISPKFQKFYDAAAAMWVEFTENGRYGATLGDVIPVSVEALKVNYRVGQWEAGALGLLDTRNVLQIAHAVIDGPAVDEYLEQKKKQDSAPVSGTADLCDGVAD